MRGFFGYGTGTGPDGIDDVRMQPGEYLVEIDRCSIPIFGEFRVG